MYFAGRFFMRVVIIGVCVFVLAACSQERRPEAILSEPQMVHALMEIHLAERKISALGVRHDSTRQLFERAAPMIFEQAGIEEAQFKKSFAYYQARPKELEAIYSILIDSLNLREQRAQANPSEKKTHVVPD